MKRNKRFVGLICVAMLVTSAGCTGQDILVDVDQVNSNVAGECDHDYHRTDYVDATTEENGYEEYTCSKCGETYQETIPKLTDTGSAEPGPDASEAPEDGASVDTEDDVANESQNKQTSLFELPVYSSSMTPDYETDILDSEGWHHENCYSMFGVHVSAPKEDAAYMRWELEGKYQTISGTIYESEVHKDKSYWLVFCDEEDQPIYTTERLTYDTTSVNFEFDVTGVDYLTMYGYHEGSSTWNKKIIADNIYIS